VKPSNIAAFWWIRVRRRLLQEALAVVGIAIGVALLTSALVANASLVGSFDRTMRSVVGDAKFQVTARGGHMEQDVAGQIAHLKYVASAAPVLESRVVVGGPRGHRSLMLLGLTADYRGLNSRITEQFSAAYLEKQQAVGVPTPIAQELGLALGEEVEISANGRRTTAPLGTLLQRDQIDDLVESPIVLAPLTFAQRLVGAPGEITRVFVRPEPGREADVERELRQLTGTRFDVRPADFEAALFRSASAPSSQSTAMFAVFSAMVGFLFAFSAVLLTVPARRSFLMDLIKEGYGTATATAVMLFDALALGVLASLLGVIVGDRVSRHLFGEVPSFLSMAFTFGTRRIVTPDAIVLAVAGGIVASCVAVLVPTASAIRQARLGPLGPGSVRRLDGGHERWLMPALGAILLAGGIAVIVIAPASTAVAIAGLISLTLAMLLLLPVLLAGAVAGLETATASVRSVVPYIATEDIRSARTRVRALAVCATGMVAVFASVALQGSHGDLQRGLDSTAGGLAGAAPVWLVTPGSTNLLATEPFTPPPLRALPPGIASIEPYRGGFLDLKDRRVWVFGTPRSSPVPIPRGQTDVPDPDLDRRLRAGGWAVVSEAVARENGWKVGRLFTLPAPRPTSFRLAAVATNMGWPPGAIVINARDFASAWGSDAISALNVTPDPGVDARAAGTALRTALGGDSNLTVKTAAARWDELNAGSRQGLAALTRIAWMVNVSAILAMAVAMAGLIWQRRPAIAHFKREGYGTKRAWRGILLQAALLTGTGCAAGAAFGLLGQRLLSRALSRVTGFPVADTIAWSTAAVMTAVITTAAVVVVGGFGYLIARVDPADTRG